MRDNRPDKLYKLCKMTEESWSTLYLHVMNKEAVFLNLPDKLAFLRVERFAKIRKLELQGLKLYKMTEESWSTLY